MEKYTKESTNIISKDEINIIKTLFDVCMESYSKKEEDVSDTAWLKNLFLNEIDNITEDVANDSAENIVKTINAIANNMKVLAVNEKKGISKEQWLAKNMSESITETDINEQGRMLYQIENTLFEKNMHLLGFLNGDNNFTDENGMADNTIDGEFDLYHIKELALEIGKNASAYGLQSASSTIGTMLATKILEGQQIEPNQIIQEALKSGMDTSLQIVTSGVLEIASQNKLIQALPESTPVEVVASISSMGIEISKILERISSGKITMTQGLEQFGRVAVSIVGNIWNVAKNTQFGGYLTKALSVFGPQFTVIAEVVGMIVAFSGGTDLGKRIANAKVKVSTVARTVAKSAMQGLKRVKKAVQNGIERVKGVLNRIFS